MRDAGETFGDDVPIRGRGRIETRYETAVAALIVLVAAGRAFGVEAVLVLVPVGLGLVCLSHVRRRSVGWEPAVLLAVLLASVAGMWALVGIAALLWALPASLRAKRTSPDAWFRRAAVFASFLAFAFGSEAEKVWQYGGAGGRPTGLSHAGFHHALDGGIEVTAVLLTLALAWGPLRQGQRWAVLGLLALAPAVAASTWSGVVAQSHHTDWAAMHVTSDGYVPAIPACFVLALICAMLGWMGDGGVRHLGA